jgi:hypothetical protein
MKNTDAARTRYVHVMLGGFRARLRHLCVNRASHRTPQPPYFAERVDRATGVVDSKGVTTRVFVERVSRVRSNRRGRRTYRVT